MKTGTLRSSARLAVCASLALAVARVAVGQVAGEPIAVSAGAIETVAAEATLQGQSLTIQATEADKPAEVIIKPAGEAWDLSAYRAIAIQVTNPGSEPVTVRGRIENEGAAGLQDSCRGVLVLMPGQSGQLTVRIMPRPEDPGYEVFQSFYMYFKNINVRDGTVDPTKIVRMSISIDHPKAGQKVEVTGIATVGEGPQGTVPFFPFVDKYGQYIHTDWPGKIYADEDFAKQIAEEARERAEWPGPKDWNEYGGWADGPQLKATGHFYATRHDGKWWLVDPSGRLFWSHGPTGVGYGGDLTPITDREHWFKDLPARDELPWGRFYREGSKATYRYYQNRNWLGYDIAAANLLRKYGDDYETEVAALSHERMRSWGFNTIANWSAEQVIALRRTPYVVAIHYGAPMIHYRMPDVYHPDWEKNVRARMERERGRTSEDPWNIGYFVDNERWWGWRPRAAAIGEETLKNPADTPAKLRFVEQLKEKYPTIEALNEAWGTGHASWETLLEHRQAPDMKNEKVLKDCGDFGMMFAERYFSVCRDAVKSVAPNIMYLGPRFHGHIDKEVVRLAGRYCDVISYNIYDNPPHGRVNQYRDLDLPIMSTEWGIGSDPQQTPFRGDNLKVPTPAERAREMARYIEVAIRHPNMVGAHFFQYRDQPLSGRPDGEATLRGFVNITDTPNFELIQANRRVAYNLYETRANAK